MFFPERIRSIKPGDRVLDVGPGAFPHPQAQVYLERRFATEEEASGQRGHAPAMADPQRVVYYDGGRFPFEDNAFDYVVCSHVLEHVDDVGAFVAELQRVAKRGYLEFPLIYYEYLYNFPEHLTLLVYRDGMVNWMPKVETALAEFSSVSGMFRRSLEHNHTSLVNSLREMMVQGFEWDQTISAQRVTSIADVTLPDSAIDIPIVPVWRRSSFSRRLVGKIWRTFAGISNKQ